MTLRERVLKRIETIKATNDQGVYAKHYVEDVTELLAELETSKVRPPCPECGQVQDNIYCALCSPIPR